MENQITIADLIKHLQTFPQDVPIFWYHDESGTYGQRIEMPGKFEDVKWNEKWNCWRDAFEESSSTKKVFVI